MVSYSLFQVLISLQELYQLQFYRSTLAKAINSMSLV